MIKHLALIMDGNRRWARKRALMPWKGHEEGIKAVETSIKFCIEKKIPILTLYAFSLENFKRSSEELSFLFSLMLEQIKMQKDKIIEQDVKVKFIGDQTLFPKILKPAINDLETGTRNCKALEVNVLFCYGGQQEIINATKIIAQKVISGELKIDGIDKNLFESFLWLTPDSSPDLVIRTGSAKRLSNFLSYQSAYSELSFLDKLWPEITVDDLEFELQKFAPTKRNFGA